MDRTACLKTNQWRELSAEDRGTGCLLTISAALARLMILSVPLPGVALSVHSWHGHF